MKKYVLLFSLCFWGGSAFAAEVDGELVCPDAKQEGVRLLCKVQLSNYGCEDVQITRAMAIFAGNSSGTLGGMGIWGPFVRSFLAGKIIPAGDADECISNGGFFATTPGTLTSNVLIIDPIPASVAPTVAAAIVEIELRDLGPLAVDGEDDIGMDAMVEILPSP